MGRDRAGTGTREKCTSEKEGEDDITKNRWESMGRGKRDEKREKEKWEERVHCLFGKRTLNTWSRCTHGSYGDRGSEK